MEQQQLETFSTHEPEIVECLICYDSKWVLNDALNMPFSALDLDLLEPGDEIIRCWECNALPGQSK